MTPTPPVKHLWRNFWMLLKPFWASKEGKAKGLLLLVIVLALTAGSVYLQKVLNSWHNQFYNSIQGYDFPEFKSLLSEEDSLISPKGQGDRTKKITFYDLFYD